MWPFEILLLDCFTAIFIKSVTAHSGVRREGLWLRIQASVQMDWNSDPRSAMSKSTFGELLCILEPRVDKYSVNKRSLWHPGTLVSQAERDKTIKRWQVLVNLVPAMVNGDGRHAGHRAFRELHSRGSWRRCNQRLTCLVRLLWELIAPTKPSEWNLAQNSWNDRSYYCVLL